MKEKQSMLSEKKHAILTAGIRHERETEHTVREKHAVIMKRK